MKRINHYNTARDKLLHIETEGGIINITTGLHNTEGQEVVSISFVVTAHEGWVLDGYANTRFIKVKGE